MQEYLNQTADARDTLSAADADDSLSDSGCRRLSIRQRMQECLHQTADAGDSLSDGRDLHPMSDRETPATAV